MFVMIYDFSMINFKTARINDVEKLAEFVNNAYRGESSKKGWTTEADLLDGQRTDPKSLKDIITTAHHRIEMAFEDEKLIGCVHLTIEEKTETLFFGMLTVDPHLQGSGVGKKILDHAEAVAHELHLKRIRMHVIHLRTELIAFYERRGFVATGNHEKFPEADPLFGLPKVQGLLLLEFVKELH